MSLSRAASDSAVLRAVRLAAERSVIWRALRAGLHWPKASAALRETRQRIVTGFGGEWSANEERRTVEHMDVLVSSSRVAAAIAWVVTRMSGAWRESRTQHFFSAAAATELDEAVRVGGVALIVAVVTHTVLMALLGVPVYRLGWSIRIFLLVLGWFSLGRTQAVVAAVRDRRAR